MSIQLFFYMNAAFDQLQREVIVENTRVVSNQHERNGQIGSRPTHNR